MSRYEEVVDRLELHECPECHGRGTCDDLEPGDIGGNEWSCESCNGTGFAKGRICRLIET